MEIAIDFDGTCVTHEYPLVGKDIGAIPVLHRLVGAGHKLLLFTMRCDNREDQSSPLTDAINWFKDNGIPLHGVQENPSQKSWTTSPKCYAQLYIDDAALGCPLVHGKHDRAYVNWEIVENYLIAQGIIE